MGTTSREIVFGKRSFDDAANAPKKERLFGQTSRTQEETQSSYGFETNRQFGSVGSIGFNIAGTTSSQAPTNPGSMFSFAPISGERNSGQAATGSQTSTLSSFAPEKPQNLFQAASKSPEKSQGISIATSSSSLSSFSPFGTPSVTTSTTSFSYSSLPESKSSFISVPVFPGSTSVTSHQESTASSIGFPVTPISTSSQQTSVVFGSKFGHTGFGFATKAKETPTPSTKPTQPFSATTNVFGKVPGQAESTMSKDISLPFKRSGKSPEEKTGSDISGLKALVIREIPEVFNKNPWLKRFYSRFGEVMKVFCNPPKKSATVTFKTHVSYSI